MNKDADGQPGFGIHFHNNKEKALAELMGFCQGVTADKALNEIEAALLDAWLRSNELWLKSDPDFFDLLDLTTDILADGRVSVDELEDLLGLLNIVLENESDDGLYSADDAITRLTGIARGMTADHVLNDKEIKNLSRWLRRCGEWKDRWPLSVVVSNVHNILKDGIITDEERNHLHGVLVDLIGGHVTEHGEVSGMSVRLGMDEPDCVEFDGKVFCFTGKFIKGSRKTCENLTTERGGNTCKTVVVKLDYLVVGALSSRDWANTSFGRKIEKAQELKESGRGVSIISEEVWVNSL